LFMLVNEKLVEQLINRIPLAKVMSLTDNQCIITQVTREDCEQIKSTNNTEKGKPLCASAPPLQMSTTTKQRLSRDVV